ncbi:MAG: 2-oxoglutarate dehydrogenase E1 subunit family protein, partial [Phycisphaerales bacterium]
MRARAVASDGAAEMAHEGPSSEGFRPHARQSLNGWQPEFVEAQYQRFLADPDSVGPEWKQFF